VWAPVTEPETFSKRAQREVRDFKALWRRHRILSSLLLTGLVVYVGLWLRTEILSGGHKSEESAAHSTGRLCSFSVDTSIGETKVACSGIPDTAVAGLVEALKDVPGHKAKVNAADDWARQYHELQTQVDAIQSRLPQTKDTSQQDQLKQVREKLEAGRLSEANKALLQYYRHTTLIVLQNSRKVFVPAMSTGEQEQEQQITFEVSPSSEIEAVASWALSGERRIVISSGLVQVLEMSARGFAVAEECGASYTDYIASIAHTDDFQSTSVISLEEFSKPHSSKCAGSPDTLYQRSGGAFFAKMMDASIANLYLRGVAFHVLKVVPPGEQISLSPAAEANDWASAVAKRAHYNLEAGLPLMELEKRGLKLTAARPN
jgi:hypothetical protein